MQEHRGINQRAERNEEERHEGISQRNQLGVSIVSGKLLIDTPARNAPSATENPTACASAAIPRHMAIATSRRSSELQVFFTRRRKGGITFMAE